SSLGMVSRKLPAAFVVVSILPETYSTATTTLATTSFLSVITTPETERSGTVSVCAWQYAARSKISTRRDNEQLLLSSQGALNGVPSRMKTPSCPAITLRTDV